MHWLDEHWCRDQPGLTGLLNGTSYYWHVRANNGAGMTYANSTGIAFWSFTTRTIAPLVTTSAASSLTQKKARLNGVVNPGGASSTTAFDYGLTTDYGSTVAAQTRTGPITQSISASAALACGVTYHFRACADDDRRRGSEERLRR